MNLCSLTNNNIIGAFREHIDALKKIPGVEAFDIRTSNDMYDGDRLKIDGLIIPGGESTAIGMGIIIYNTKEEY